MSDGTADAAAAAAAAAVPTLTARDLEILVHAFQTPKSGVEFEVDYQQLAPKLGSKTAASAKSSWNAVKKKLVAKAAIASSVEGTVTGKPKTPRKKKEDGGTKETPKSEVKNTASDESKKGKLSTPAPKSKVTMSHIEAIDSDDDQDISNAEGDAIESLTDDNKLIKSEVDITENDKAEDEISVEVPTGQKKGMAENDKKGDLDPTESSSKTVAPLTPQTSPTPARSVSPVVTKVKSDKIEADKEESAASTSGAKDKSTPVKTPAKTPAKKKTPSKQAKKEDTTAAADGTEKSDKPKSTPKKRSRAVKADKGAENDDPTSDAEKPAPKKQRKTPVKKKAVTDDTADADSPMADAADTDEKKATPKAKRPTVAEKRKQAKLDEEAKEAAEADAEKAAVAAKKKAESAAAMEANEVLTGKKKVETKSGNTLPAPANGVKDEKADNVDTEEDTIEVKPAANKPNKPNKALDFATSGFTPINPAVEEKEAEVEAVDEDDDDTIEVKPA